jgi:hypothetical protein
MPDYLDAELDNADWTKQTWDLQLTAGQITLMPLADLQHLMTLPAWRAAPKPLQEAAASRLAAIADD